MQLSTRTIRRDLSDLRRSGGLREITIGSSPELESALEDGIVRATVLHYADYLKLSQLLSCQDPESVKKGSKAHDETLFIIVHQVYELWFKQVLHELDSVCEIFRKDWIDEKQIGIAVSRVERVTEIEKIMIDQLRVMETMTPLDFLEFRHLLTPASGFQSEQFRRIEITLGVKSEQSAWGKESAYRSRALKEHATVIEEANHQSPLFELVDQWLARTPFLKFKGFDFWAAYRKAVEEMLQRDETLVRDNPTLSKDERERELREFKTTQNSFEALFDEEQHQSLMRTGQRRLSFRATHAALFVNLYRDQPMLTLPFRFLTALVDMDELLTTWRYRHTLMVFRMIGTKIGTGGTSGYSYLKSTVESRRVFADLANLSTFLIPRSALPELPVEIQKNLDYRYSAGR